MANWQPGGGAPKTPASNPPALSNQPTPKSLKHRLSRPWRSRRGNLPTHHPSFWGRFLNLPSYFRLRHFA